MRSGSRPRLLVLGLDGFELSIAETLMAEGQMPHFKRLHERSASFALDHGDARDTGLAWEHFCTGKRPEDYHRWSAIDFDPATYAARQLPTATHPFTSKLPGKVVLFDVPYHRLEPHSAVRGMANWGAHDPGVEMHSNPLDLCREVTDRFGEYPAREYIYGFVWPDAERARDMADKLTAATRKRTEIVEWLLTDRMPDWDTAIVSVSEPHSGLEALWHGWDKTHPLHDLESAVEARRGIVSIYREIDRLVGMCSERFPDAAIVPFTMHGMGSNTSDVLSMALLPELLFRLEFGQENLQARPDWLLSQGKALGREEDWSSSVNSMLRFHYPSELPRAGGGKEGLASFLARIRGKADETEEEEVPIGLKWMPCAHYAPFWPKMDSFVLPAFYDGQIRLNVEGRERSGRIRADQIGRTLDELERQLLQLRDGLTGEPVVKAFRRPVEADPMAAARSQCDLIVQWRTASVSVEHPVAGRIGPVPFRRTGGHTGDAGFAWLAGPGIDAVSGGRRDAFDLPATVGRLAGIDPQSWDFSGSDLLEERLVAS